MIATLSRRPFDPMRTCAGCAYATIRSDTGEIACGAGVDDEALKDLSRSGVNPIWAERKRAAIVALLQGRASVGSDDGLEGSDAERMKPEDGGDCATWQRRTPLGKLDWTAPDKSWAIKARAEALEAAIPKLAARWLKDGPPEWIEIVAERRDPRQFGDFHVSNGFAEAAALFLGPDFEWDACLVIGEVMPVMRALRYIGDQEPDHV